MLLIRENRKRVRRGKQRQGAADNGDNYQDAGRDFTLDAINCVF